MLKIQLVVGSTLLATCVAMVGCDAKTFAAANDSYTKFKSASSTFGSAAVPAAAIAAAAGGMEMVKAMSNNSSKIIAAGGGNIIAAGGGNLRNKYDLAEVKKLDDTGDVKGATVDFQSSPQEGRTLTSTINEFKCNSAGYTIVAKGSFKYTLAETAGDNAYILFQVGKKGDVACTMEGEVSYNDTKIALKDLNFNTSDPLPEDSKESIGGFTLQTNGKGDEFVKVVAKVFIRSKKIVAEGTSQIGENGTPKPINFDQDNSAGLAKEASGK